MMVFAPVVILLVLTGGFLLAWAVRLRRRLRAALHATELNHAVRAEEVTRLPAPDERLARQNRCLQDRLDDCQQELAALCYSVSHDLRAPLRSISGFSQALAEDYGPRLDANAQDYLRRVRTSALQLNDLIDELLALSRIVRAPFRIEAVDLSALAREIAAELQADDPTRRVQWDLPPTLPVKGDPALLATALRHLLGNAWKFSAGRSTAHIALRVVPPDVTIEEAGAVVYEVRDNGVGFDMQYAGKLFGVFQRLHAAGEFPGRGVGLATTRRIVRRHGGQIWAAAEPGEGAVFSFTLDPATDRLSVLEAGDSKLPPVAVAAPEMAGTLEPKPSIA